MTDFPPLRIGLVGFGVGGQYFHAPFIEAAQGVQLAGVVTGNPERRHALATSYPGVPAYHSLAELIAAERNGAGLDAVTITTPPQTRRDLVLEALSNRLHVVADKPFAPDAAGAAELEAAATTAGLSLAVYHNRRWDSDILTLRQLIHQDRLGSVSRFHSRMDQAGAATLEGGPTGGLLRDLGSHLVDQALWLFGSADQVYADLTFTNTPEGRTDSAFHLTLRHPNGVISHLSATKLNHMAERELRVYGTRGAYTARGIDIQAHDSFQGRRPAGASATWGREPKSHWGSLYTSAGSELIPAEPGNYSHYYEQFAQAIRTGTPVPVTPRDAVHVLEVLSAARTSAETRTAVSITPGRDNSGP